MPYGEIGTDPPAPTLAGTPPPAPDTDLRALAEAEARKVGLDPSLVHRLIDRESKWNPHAVSSKGAQGLMQLMPDTASAYGVKDPFDPAQNIRGGVAYLKKLMDDNKGDQRLALASYNAGPAQVKRFKDVPPFPETRGYVNGITGTEPVHPGNLQFDGGAEPVHPAQLKFDDPSVDPHAFQMDDPAHPNPVVQAGKQAAAGAQRLTPEYGPIVQFLRAVPAAVGSMAGQLEKATGPVGAVIGSALSGAGAAAGELGTIGAEHVGYDLGLTGVPPPTWEGALSRVQDAATAGAGGELFGRGAGKVIGTVAAPFASGVDAEGKAVAKAFPNALPNQVSTSPLLDTMTHVAEHAPFTGKGIATRKAQLANEASQKAMGIVQHYGGPITPETAGQTFQDSLEHNTQAFHAQADSLYRDVDTAGAGTVRVPGDTLQQLGEQELEKRGAIPGEVSGDSGLRLLRQFANIGKPQQLAGKALEDAKGAAAWNKVPLDQFLQDPKFAPQRAAVGIEDNLPKDLSFQQASFLRSQMLGRIRRATAEKDDVLKGVLQQAVKHLDTAMETAGNAQSPAVMAAYRKANDFYKVGKGKYESDLMRGLADQYPEDVADKLVTPGATTPIREARAAVSPTGWGKIQAHVADKLIQGATSQDGTIIDGSKLIGKLREMSMPTLKEVFPADHATDLWSLGRVLDRAQRKIPSGGKMAIYLGQAGLATGALHYGPGHLASVGAGVIMLGPAALSRLMASPLGAKWLSIGFHASPGTKLAAQAATKLIAQLGVDRDAPPSPQIGTPPPGPPSALAAAGTP